MCSLGLLSFGVLAIGVLALGLISLGTFAFGLLAVGSIAFGLFATGAISFGIVSFGALSIGCFSSGALAIGKYAAAGDHAYAMLAVGASEANGSALTFLGELTAADKVVIQEWLDSNVPVWLTWTKEIFKFFLL